MWSARNCSGDVGSVSGTGSSRYEKILSRSSGVRVLTDMVCLSVCSPPECLQSLADTCQGDGGAHLGSDDPHPRGAAT